MRLLTDSELRSLQMEILDDVHHFCQSAGIRYSLAYGTLLGAVRHKGYIPWDDDIDLMMPRPDYERFIKEYASPGNELIVLKRIDSCVEMFTKVSRKGTRMVDKELGRCLWGVNIDIFPVDGCPDDDPGHRILINKKIELLAKLCPRYKVVKSKKPLWFAKYLVKRLLYFYPHSILHLKEETDTLASCDPATTPMAGVLMEGGDSFVTESSLYQSYTELPFEQKSYCSIQDFDRLLTAKYGDYMTPPPPENRVSLHQYDVYSLS